MTGHHPAVIGLHPDFLGLHGQVADGQHQIVADGRPMAHAQGAQRIGGEGVWRNLGAQGHGGGQGPVQVEGKVLRLGLQPSSHAPFLECFEILGHAAFQSKGLI